jgi:hypothetical protein
MVSFTAEETAVSTHWKGNFGHCGEEKNLVPARN